MICRKCGSTISEDKPFCHKCGERIVPDKNTPSLSGSFFSAPGNLREAPAADRRENDRKYDISDDARKRTNVIYSSPEEKKYCAKCGTAIKENYKFCSVCGTPLLGKDPTAAPEQTARKKKLLIIGAAAVTVCLFLCAVFVILSLVTANGPLGEILVAADNTLNASSFAGNVAVYRNGERRESYNFEVAVSPKDSELAAIIRDDGYTLAVYNGNLLYKSGSYVFKEDIKDELRRAFDVYNNSDLSDIDIAKLLHQIDPSGEAYSDVSQEMDIEALNECVETFIKCLNDEKWLENNAGYYTSEYGNVETYYFDLGSANMQGFIESMLEIFKPAFRSQGDYYDMKDDIADIDESVRLEVSVEGKYLTSIIFTIDDYSTYRYVITFNDIGGVDIDMEQLSYWLSIAAE